MKILLKTVLFTALAVTISVSSASAEDMTQEPGEIMDIPAVSAPESAEMSDTHPILRLSQDKSEMIKLDKEAASVIVGNPNHISVLLDTPDTLIVVPRANGASHFSVIGKDGTTVMQRHVIVGAAKDQYVRIRRSCNGASQGCEPTSVYFCPDMCHEVRGNTSSRSSSGSGFGFNF